MWAARPAVEPASNGAGLSCVYHRTTRKRAELSENFRKPLFYSAEVANILFNPCIMPSTSCSALLFAKRNGAPKSYPSAWLPFFLLLGCEQGRHPWFIGFKQSVITWDYYFLGCKKQEMQSIHKMHRTVCFVLFSIKCVFISARIFRDQDLKELLKRIYLWMSCFIALSNTNAELSLGELCFNSLELAKGKITSQKSGFATFSP